MKYCFAGNSLCFFAVLACFAACSGAAAEPAELVRLKEAYAAQIDLLSKGIGDLDAKYIAALKRQEETETKSGDLDAVIAIRKEMEIHGDGSAYREDRFRERLSHFDGLRKIQNTYLQTRANLEQELRKEKVQLEAAYAKQLESLVEALTKSSRIEDAVAVRTELEKLGGSADSPAEQSPTMRASDGEEKEAIRARAHVTGKAEIQIFVNGEELFIRTDNPDDESGTDGKSRFFEIHEGDTVLVRTRGTFVYRSVALAFDLPDKKRIVFFGPRDMKVLGKGNDLDPKSFDAKAISEKPAVHPETILPDSYWVKRWDDHKLDGGEFLKPGPQGEWVIWGCVLTKEMLER